MCGMCALEAFFRSSGWGYHACGGRARRSAVPVPRVCSGACYGRYSPFGLEYALNCVSLRSVMALMPPGLPIMVIGLM